MTDGDVQFDWARAIVAAFAAGGGRDAVLSPGSRSTPLALALAASGLRITSVVDERAAAFYALGQARASGRPSLLVCTSGSAGAHYLPAFVEAREAGIPLVAVTANRPSELEDVGASQTTRQLGLLDSHALWAVSLGPASADPDRRRAMASRVARAISIAVSGPGPVHVDAPFRKPLEPTTWPPSSPPATPIPSWARSVRHAEPSALDTIAADLRDARSGVVVVGPLGPAGADAETAEKIRELCATTGFVLLAETTSGLRDGVRQTRSGAAFDRADAFDLLLRDAGFASRAPVDAIVQIGRAPVSKWFGEWARARRDDACHVVIAPHGWHDADHSADHLVIADVGPTVAALTERLADAMTAQAQVAEAAGVWSRADATVWDAILAAALDDGDATTAAAVVRSVAAGLPDGGLLVVGNSLTVRDLDWFCAGLPEHVGVLSQRGTAGIDGLIAGTLGAASCNRGRPTTALLGDVALMHDIGALQLASTVAGSDPVVIVVVDNGGGRIFDMLPVARVPAIDRELALFTTPPTTDIARVCEAFGVPVAQPKSVSELVRALRSAWEQPGLSIVLADVDGDVARHREVFARVDAALAALAEGHR